jgi:hypothetical protein
VIYAICIQAIKRDWNRTIIELNVMVTNRARSEDEAVGIGMKEADHRWPALSGYSNHRAHAIMVPSDWKDHI